jgi:mannose-6-phosphate isomerase-like protein (cupin superfamily)
MSDYTHVNLKDDVENVSERFGLAPNLEARYGRRPLELEGGGFSYQRLAPNHRPPTAHRHHTHEEVYVVLAGSGRIKIEDELRDVRQWDAIRLAPGTARAFEAGPDGLELLAIGFGEAGDAEMLDDFWGDVARRPASTRKT